MKIYLAQFEVPDDELSTAGTSDMEGESRTWIWNESVNETDLDCEEKR